MIKDIINIIEKRKNEIRNEYIKEIPDIEKDKRYIENENILYYLKKEEDLNKKILNAFIEGKKLLCENCKSNVYRSLTEKRCKCYAEQFFIEIINEIKIK